MAGVLPMQKFLIAHTMFLAIFFPGASPRAVYAGEVLSQPLAQQHGLTRAWHTQASVSGARHHVAHVTLQGDTLYVVSDNGMVDAINAETGRIEWRREVGVASQLTLAPAANDRYVAIINGVHLHLLNRKDGSEEWRRDVGGSPGAGPALSDTHVFVPMISGLIEGHKIRIGELEEHTPWSYRSEGRILIPPWVTPRSVCWTTDQGYFYVSDTVDLGIKFRLKTKAPIESRPAYWTPFYYACSLDGYVYAVDEGGGKPSWKFSIGEPFNQPPVAIEGRVYVIPNSNSLFCLSGTTGRQIWIARGVRQFVAASPGRVYAEDRFGQIIVLDAETGKRIDTIPVDSGSKKLVNTQSDRMYLYTATGTIQCLREQSHAEPVRYEPPKSTDRKATVKGDGDKKPERAKSSDDEAMDEEPIPDGDLPLEENEMPDETLIDDDPGLE